MKEFLVVFQNLETGKCAVDTFCGTSENKAKKEFKECYRHGFYRIISVIEKPEITTEIKKEHGLFN